jgi:transcriptional regulator with XRE-family HTH domain
MMASFNSILYEILGERIKNKREELDLNQNDLSEKINIGRTSISNIEKGRQQPPLHILYEICNALDVDIHTILPTFSEIQDKLNIEKPDVYEKYLDDFDVNEAERKEIENFLKELKNDI